MEDDRTNYLYALADLENTRKRLERRVDEAVTDAKRGLLRKFLRVLDNLERALAAPDSEGLRTGIAATVRDFESLLVSEGVTQILTTGQRFDPRVAEAVESLEVDGVEDGMVIAEEQRGYLTDNDVLRPARVVVAKRG